MTTIGSKAAAALTGVCLGRWYGLPGRPRPVKRVGKHFLYDRRAIERFSENRADRRFPKGRRTVAEITKFRGAATWRPGPERRVHQ